ncbi:MAG: carboxypeptidase-like regulatory domain-containing protein, partial [Calditrichia bacterium]|nr:carboxypeptidase-like regulatory domain-containing protein [Calditrichia bacterium]
MINYFNRAFFSSLIVILLFFSIDSFAGTTGKIAGIVLDAKTGEPLVGCNIVIEGTPIGAATDQDGYYFIINVKPGKYVVTASMLGYSTIKMTNVQVMLDLTTKANFDMKSSMLELGEAIIVVAERPMVQKDITSKQTIVSSSEIANMAVDNFQEVLTTKAGFTTDANGEIHVRGGRSGEIAYMIDGMMVDDPLYGGFNSMVNEDAIDEMVVLSGTFNAEYGDAMSSVVNIVTKEGSDEYHGKFEYGSAMLNESPYRKKNAFSGFEDSYEYEEKDVIDGMEFDLGQLNIPIAGTYNLSLNGPVPLSSKLFFFLSGRYKNENSYLPHGYNFERDGFMKLTYRFNPSVKVT